MRDNLLLISASGASWFLTGLSKLVPFLPQFQVVAVILASIASTFTIMKILVDWLKKRK